MREKIRAGYNWRKSRSRKTAIPDELCSMAINVARREGVNRTAQQLHLDAGKLKRLLVAADGGQRKSRRQSGFVELIAAAPALHGWLDAQFAERRVEPNSSLGKAITYLLRHWKPLTLFLRQAGAPLDNNLCERALKRAVLHRTNALFYRTLNGAQVGDLFMSLIHTCQLCGVNSFDYLVELQRHAGALAASPAEWMPWNYRETIARI